MITRTRRRATGPLRRMRGSHGLDNTARRRTDVIGTQDCEIAR